MSSEEQVKALQKEVAMLREVLAKCLKARQVNHIKQIIKETLYGSSRTS